ncbi:MAG: hypothetical protein OEW77_11135 [Gemmatimonadota bacterium]|nr:hypothetical protein [Gemmatimonadota bacterium]
MRSLVLLVGLGTLCAWPLAGQGLPRPGDMLRLEVAGYSGRVPLDSVAIPFEVAAPRGATFHAAAELLVELGITPALRDSVRGAVGIANVVIRRKFAKESISRFLDCGLGIMGANADNWRMHITAFAFAVADGPDRSTLKVTILGAGRDVAGTYSEELVCASTGAFERMVAERVRRRLQ